ncbi:YbgC/FadM family acyl-CoA thioesterase [Nitrosophilus kaiyonis]|uniref:YbgC/FadM family acyl-CoA thioesterase n=1 Tax=Nitrosophilus kaiyonis TaxID=2930200 RepID=UPI002493636D|nr:YbgC/FadM family acyl-CoA thioesterase [Nitrosophilus kaiyonis]
MKIRVYYEDTDLGGVVYYANYLKFCERARSEIFFKNNLLPVKDGCHFVVTEIKAKYIKPARFADILEVETKVLEIKRVYIKLKQIIYKNSEKIFEMEIKLAFICNDRPSAIPQDFLNLFEKL